MATQLTDTGASSAPNQGPSTPAEPVASPAAGSGAPSPGASPESPNIRQLREQYENLKGQHEQYQKLGDFEGLQRSHAIATRLASESVELGTRLGYDEAEVLEAIQTDPAGTIAFLRQKAAEAEKLETPQDIDKLVDQRVNKRLQPFEKEFAQRQVEKAMGLYDTAFKTETKKLFGDEALPPEEMEAVDEVTWRLMSEDEGALRRLKFEGKTSDVAKYIEAARQFLDKYYLARSNRETKRIGGVPTTKPAAGQPQGASPKLSIGETARDFVKNLM